jgi:hypothetical protein
MEVHEFDRLSVVTRRAAEQKRPVERPPQLTTSSALLSLQRMAGNENVSALLTQDQDETGRSPLHEVVGSGGGSPLEPGARSFMEDRLGADFSDVRVHTGPKADESAHAISAQAYTVGSDVVFRGGSYQPDTEAGRHVLAHELAHVVQQRSGPVEGTPAPGGISLSHPSDSFEQAAERTASAAMAGESATTVPAGAGDAVTAQRAGEDEEEVQALTAQREEGDDLEEEPGI